MEIALQPAVESMAPRIARDGRSSRAAREAEKEVRLRAARLQALADASQAFAETRLHLPTLLTTVARRVAELVGDGCIVLLLTDEDQRSADVDDGWWWWLAL